MSLTQYYTATTLDGFIADSNDSLEWLFTRNRGAGAPLLPRRIEPQLEELGRNGDFVAARFSVSGARRPPAAAP